jgi:hypothetical protein
MAPRERAKLFRAYTVPTVDEAKKMGVLLDYRILIHSWAGRDNVVIMQKFGSFGAIHSDTSSARRFAGWYPTRPNAGPSTTRSTRSSVVACTTTRSTRK